MSAVQIQRFRSSSSHKSVGFRRTRAAAVAVCVSITIPLLLGGCLSVSPEAERRALDGYARQWTVQLRNSDGDHSNETIESVADTYPYNIGSVFISYAEPPRHVEHCDAPENLVKFISPRMLPYELQAGSSESGGTSKIFQFDEEHTVDLTFNNATEDDLSAAAFLKWLGDNEECRKAFNQLFDSDGSGPVRIVLGVVSAQATVKISSRTSLSIGVDAGFTRGDTETDSAPRQYFLDLYTLDNPISSGTSADGVQTTSDRGSASSGQSAVQPAAPPGPVAPRPAEVTRMPPVAPPVTPARDIATPTQGGSARPLGQPKAQQAAFPTAPDAGSTAATDTAPNVLPTQPSVGSDGAKLQRARSLYAEGRYDQAALEYDIAYYDSTTESDSENALVGWGSSLVKLNKDREACVSISTLRDRFPEVPANIESAADHVAEEAHCTAAPSGQ